MRIVPERHRRIGNVGALAIASFAPSTARVHNVHVPGSNVDVIRHLNAAFNAGDSEAFQSLLDPDVEFLDHMPLPDVAQEAHGVAETMKVLEHWHAGFSGFRADVEDYIDLDDYVVCSTRWRFTSRDEGIDLEWRGAEAHQVHAGKVVWSAVGFRDVRAAIQAVEQRQAV